MVKEENIALLYAEDDPQARELLERLIRFKFPELTVHVAADGEQGLALFNEHRHHVILTDITMPALDGIEMTRRIREMKPDAIVIALTAYSDSDWQVKSRELNFNHCITKPVEFRPLLAVLGEALDTLRGGQAALPA